jgi:hypothetical protein
MMMMRVVMMAMMVMMVMVVAMVMVMMKILVMMMMMLVLVLVLTVIFVHGWGMADREGSRGRKGRVEVVTAKLRLWKRTLPQVIHLVYFLTA